MTRIRNKEGFVSNNFIEINRLPWWLSSKEYTCSVGDRRYAFDPLVRKILEQGIATHFIILAWGYSPWSHKESDMT